VDLKKLVAERATGVGIGRLQPRWARVNGLKSTIQEQMFSTFSAYTQTPTLADVICASPEEKLVCADQHIPDLLALPPGIDLIKTQAYKNGEFVLQDKASCFPAYLLLGGSASHNVGDILDACAAPGNKTTHLASIIRHQSTVTDSARSDFGLKIFACERDPLRSETLRKMVKVAGADDVVTVLAKQDFLALDPDDARFTNVTHLLLDPSCSGSGIVGRDDMPVLQLPEDPRLSKAGGPISPDGKARGKSAPNKRKRRGESESNGKFRYRDLESEEVPREVDFTRLDRLANLQTKIIEHAFSFPAARRITYSTCSIHGQENEAVVLRALSGHVATERGWRVMRRDEQPDGLTRWPHRGRDLEDRKGRNLESSQTITPRGLSEDEKQACIRCQTGDEEGTMGFFVCGFVRDCMETEIKRVEEESPGRRMSHEVDEEWEGFSDDETIKSIH
jgi:25S rRNA (cytosine2278-C5)-methyltransferase